MRKNVFMLQGLDCAHCAEKIANKVRKQDGIEDAEMNFMMQKLTVLSDRSDIETVVEKIVHEFEPAVFVKKK